MKKFCFWFDKSPVVAAMIMFLMVFGSAGREGRILQESVAEKVLRFHVRANSDTVFDQQLKLKARDEVLAYLAPMLTGAEGLEETKAIIQENFLEIQDKVREVSRIWGKDYEARVYFTKEYFPARVYGNVTLPPGEYQALRIDIGEAKGKNWWCILYPTMCFVESTHARCEDSELTQVLTGEEYDYVTGYEIRFKYLTFLNPKEEQKVSEVENAAGSTDIH